MINKPLEMFNSPAHQAEKDFANDPNGLQKFRESWNSYLKRWTEQSIFGSPGAVLYDRDRYYYFNPLETALPDDAPIQPITWVPFPNRLFIFFQDSQSPIKLDTKQIFELCDKGQIEIDGKLTKQDLPKNWFDTLFIAVRWLLRTLQIVSVRKSCKINEFQIPKTLCPDTDWKGEKKNYDPPGPRGWLDEYCEWSITYDTNGKLKKVVFTCENPGYWFALWHQDPDLVTQLYQQYVHPNVRREDLYLRDGKGNPVIDPLTDDYAYNPTNKWNSGTQSLPDRGGAIHLTSPPNTLSAEITLAAAATVARQCDNDEQTIICCSQYGRPRRNSDPHIGQLANQLASQFCITLADPVGLYIQTPDFSKWSVKGRTDYDVTKFWSIERGEVAPLNSSEGFDSILHAVFTVPNDLEPEDILITRPNGEILPLQWAGQIAETFKIALRAVAIAPQTLNLDRPVPQNPLPCRQFVAKDDPNLQPVPSSFLPLTLSEADSPIDLSPDVKQGTTVTMALVVSGGLENAEIGFFPADGIGHITIKKFIDGGESTQSFGDANQTYIFDLTISPDAPLGERKIQIKNLDRQEPQEGMPWFPGFLRIVSA